MTSVMTSELPDKLDQPPLRLALVQVMTTPLLAVEQVETVDPFIKAMDGWTLIERHPQQQTQMVLGPDGLHQQAGPPQTVWVLADADNSARISITQDFAAVETVSYDTWQQMYGALDSLLTEMSTHFNPPRATRLGVRYVNELPLSEDTPLDRLAEVLCPPLIAAQADLGLVARTTASELRLLDDLEIKRFLTIRHGLQPDGSYMLDLDCYVEGERAFDREELLTLAAGCHQRIRETFWWALSGPARQRLIDGKPVV